MINSRLTLAVFGLCVAGACPLAAQGPAFDTSGNGTLNGNYYFRQVYYVPDNSGTGGLTEAISLYGNIVFSGSGTYQMNGVQAFDSNNGVAVPLACEVALLANTQLTLNQCNAMTNPVYGTYTLAASGYGYLSNALVSSSSVYITVGNSGSTTGGLISGSSTESGFNDLFIGAKVVTTPTVATFNGQWTMAGFFPGGTPAGAEDIFFQLSPNGGGSLGNVAASGYIGGAGTTIETQNISGAKYIFSNGAAVLEFPTSTASNAYYFSGNEYLYFSPDNNFVFGGSPNGYDMLVGIRNDASGTIENFAGLYYQSGIDIDLSTYATAGYANFDTYYGSLSAVTGNIVGAQRINNLISDSSAYSSTFADSYPIPVVGSGAITDSGTQLQFAYGDNGAVRIGAGIWPYLGLSVAFQAPAPSATGSVYLYPTGITNAASSAPFTAGISNGELLTLYGTGLAASTVIAPGTPFPTSLGGVQVLIDGQAAPIYYVSPGQVSVIVPYEIPSSYSVASIQVVNNNVSSNIVTEFMASTSVGLFTVPPGGLGYGALLHNATGQLVTTSNPAEPGEYVQAFVTGLGNVYPTIQDGAAGPGSPLSCSIYYVASTLGTCSYPTPPTSNEIAAYVGGVSAPVVYAGLAPGLAGLYQIDLQIPTGLTAGDNDIDFAGPDSYTSQALISIGTGTSSTLGSGASAEVVSPKSVVRRKPASQEKPHQPRPSSFPIGSRMNAGSAAVGTISRQ